MSPHNNPSHSQILDNQNLDRTAKLGIVNIERTANAAMPTLIIASELQNLHSHINQEFFGGELSEAVLTLDQTSKVSCGHFKPDSFISKNGTFAHEIGIGAGFVLKASPEEIISTMGHEMAHQAIWEQSEKKPSSGYHCKSWAILMEGTLGLVPSDTGREGGKKTGYRMCEYILPGGPFEHFITELICGQFSISWALATEELRAYRLAEVTGKNKFVEGVSGLSGSCPADSKKKRSKGKVKFQCPSCEKPAWAASSRLLICGDCHVELVERP